MSDIFAEDFFDDDIFEDHIVMDNPQDSQVSPPAQPPLSSPVIASSDTVPDVPESPDLNIDPNSIAVEATKLLSIPPDDRLYFPVETPNGRFYLGSRTDSSQPAPTISGRRSFADVEREALEVHRLRVSESLAASDRLGSSGREPSVPWVDKYVPRSFLDLLTAAETNRQLMQWLKTWRTKIETPTKKMEEEQEDEENPHRQVLLVCGPSGCGKSSMLQICSKKLGFEISDNLDNLDTNFTKDAVENEIVNVCTNLPVNDMKKHRLLLLDVDGDRLNVALEAVLKKSQTKLARPVVVLLTAAEPDALLWSKTVRPLHATSQMLKLGNPAVLKLQERVREVARLENLVIESLAINKLVEICGNDIRAALNQLQALAAAKPLGEVITVTDVVTLAGSGAHGNRAGGIKDTERSEEELLATLFKPRRARLDEKKYMQTIVNEILPEVKADGISNNLGYLLAHGLTTVPFTDPGLRTMRQVTQALALGDRVGDLSLATLAISAGCSGVGQLRFDMIDFKRNSKLRYQLDQDRKAAFNALIFPRKSARDTRLVLLPGLHLATRSPGHPNWLKDQKAEHPELERLVQVFFSYGLNLAPVIDPKNPQTEEQFQLAPNLDLLTSKFPLWQGRDAFENHLITPFWRANPAYVELFLKKLALLNKVPAQLVTKVAFAQPPATTQTPGSRKRTSITPAGGSNSKKSKSSHASAAVSINMQDWCGASAKKRLDFENMDANGKQVSAVRNLFEFHYQEGHTNAVKRPVYLKEFTTHL